MFLFKIPMHQCKHSNCRFKIFCKVFSFLTMGSSDGEGLSQIYLQLLDAYKKRFTPQNGQVTVLKYSPIWKKERKIFKISEPKAQFYSQKEASKREAMAVLAGKGYPTFLMEKGGIFSVT